MTIPLCWMIAGMEVQSLAEASHGAGDGIGHPCFFRLER